MMYIYHVLLYRLHAASEPVYVSYISVSVHTVPKGGLSVDF